MKRILLATVAIFIAWSVMDFIIHGIMLKPMYEETMEFWRPQEEYKAGLMMGVSLLIAFIFTSLYAGFSKTKNLCSGFNFGLLYGLATGISAGVGTYCYMPIPFSLAMGWLAGILVELIAAGLIVGALVKDPSRV